MGLVQNGQHRVEYFGHSASDGGGPAELLQDHLRRVAIRTGQFAAAFGCQQQGYAAGLLHDIGKYSDKFQQRLRGNSVAHCDHWTIGTLVALTAKQPGLFPALAIAGHHSGLEWLKSTPGALATDKIAFFNDNGDRFGTPKNVVFQRFLADGFQAPSVAAGLSWRGVPASDLLDVRMLFSALVDADFLETEAHFNGDRVESYRPRPEGPTLDPVKALAGLEKHLASLRVGQQSPMSSTREALYAECVAAAQQSQGVFTLSAPTGAGKTLAMLAFALHHARTHGLRRVIVVMPFLNIIDQTAGIYRNIFSQANGFADDTVIEHHSLADRWEDGSSGGSSDDGQADRLRLLTQNWDAPVVLTTNVQFFQSLMADRPSACRKLHRLARSVILCDEVQTLPPESAVATLATLSRLCDPAGPYRATAVLSTATQPAFEALDQRICPALSTVHWQPREIAQDNKSLFQFAAQRVSVAWRHQDSIPLAELADELHGHRQVLCIVNLKRHAIELATALRERDAKGLLHLSTNMCPAHRAAVLAKVYQRLKDGKPVRLIATQCVEAGVDLDFPLVYRALAPLEAIAQAAGRCNRHGLGRLGKVVVFKPQDDRRLYPPGYDRSVDATVNFLAALALHENLDDMEILNNPNRLNAYYQQLYCLSGRATSELDDERPLLDAMRAGDFAEVARLYRLIKSDTVQILVPYDAAEFDALRAELRDMDEAGRIAPDRIRRWIRRASPHAVNLFRPTGGLPLDAFLEPVQFGRRRPVEAWNADWFAAMPEVKYDRLLGISTEVENLWVM